MKLTTGRWSEIFRGVLPILIVSLLEIGTVGAEPKTMKLDVGPIAVEIDIERQVVGLSEPVEISITLLSSPHVEMRWPTLAETESHYRVMDTRTDGPDTLGRFQARRWHVRIEPLRLGKLEISPLVIEYRSGQEDWQSGSIPVPAFEIVPGPTSSSDPSSLRPLPSVGSEPAVVSSRVFRWLRYAGLALAAIFGPWALFTWMRSRSDRKTAVDIANDELRRIEKELELPTAEPRSLITALADQLRDYLSRAYGLSAPRQSTQEFLADDNTQNVLSTNQREALSEFLLAADVEKFGADSPTMEDCRTCIRRARAFLAGEKPK